MKRKAWARNGEFYGIIQVNQILELSALKTFKCLDK